MKKVLSLLIVLTFVVSVANIHAVPNKQTSGRASGKKESPKEKPQSAKEKEKQSAKEKPGGWCGACNKPNSACGR